MVKPSLTTGKRLEGGGGKGTSRGKGSHTTTSKVGSLQCLELTNHCNLPEAEPPSTVTTEWFYPGISTRTGELTIVNSSYTKECSPKNWPSNEERVAQHEHVSERNMRGTMQELAVRCACNMEADLVW